MLSLAQRNTFVEQSEIRAMTLACAKVGGINLAQGVCDLEVPAVVREGAARAMADGYNIYTRFDGLPELRRAIADHEKTFKGLTYDPEGEVVVSCGGTGAFYAACLALLNPGDEVLVFEPFYGYHVLTLASLDLKAVPVPLHAPEWGFTLEDLNRLATPRTRALVVNTPMNPLGKVFSRQELAVVAEFAKARDLFVFTDEIYEHFVYDGLTHVAPASLPGMRERTIAMSGLSKIFSITGWRLGYAVCDRKWAGAIGHFNDLVYVCAPAPLQMGAAKGLAELPRSYYEGVAADHLSKRARMCAALDRAGLTPIVPQGAYYVLADLTRLPGADDRERALFLLKETGVACVPGRAFFSGGQGAGLGRFCFSKKDPVLDEACARLARLG
jgi:aminotransferase